MNDEITDAEKVEAIFESRASGTFGKFIVAGERVAIIELDDGRRFKIVIGNGLFNVHNLQTGYVGIAETVLDAADLAIRP